MMAKEDSVTSTLIIVQLVLELLALVARALEAGEQISDEQLSAVFGKVEAANAAWQAALNKEQSNG